ncbi:T9SS type B sorting domain-containing protein [Flavobacterium sp. IMCC34852]|uniref:T9SS type B sorting domain-containing protein n=1 Tax=Flavobacterium rivulicola TaxID=2732161 RepID=A0A7Y3VZ95_9FLAO|nr:gliding motility-associated C-terminal domain-containing protein [Flavobacterium sp. IMCC34852]NNT72514.1 T9SS type B sorting domain-containing protein [Flavobacterium sp. IMCC34852]
MRITTLAKNYFFYCVLVLTLIGQNGFVYSQCPTVTDATQSFCDTQSPTVASLVATDNGGGIKWYATATSNTQLPNSTVLVNGQDYFADDNTGNCGPRQSVTVTIYSAPTGANFQGVCVTSLSQATPSNPQFVIFGNNLQWYTTPSGGTALSPTAILNDNTIYYISQTNPDTGCQTSRLSVFVNVGLVPPPTGDAIQEFCNIPGSPPTIGDLVASGNNNWYLNPTFGIPLDPSTPLINGQFYYASTVDPPCESVDRLEVLVNLYEPNDAGSDGNRSICVNEIPTTAPFDLFDFLGGTPDNSGVWSGPIATTNGFQGTLDVSAMTLAGSPYVFTYTVSSALCAPDISTVTITILDLPSVSVAVSPTTICANDSATFTFTGTPNATVTYNINGGSNQTVVLNAGGTATITGTYTADTTVNIVSVASSGTPSCVNPQTSSITLTVLPLPTASVAVSPTTICANDSATFTFTGTPNATVTYNINGGANQTVVLGAAGTATLTGTYMANTTINIVSVASSGTPSCVNLQPSSVVLTVLPLPTASVSVTPPTICLGDSATFTFTGTPNATVTYNIDGGANQTVVLDAAGTATLTGTYSANTTVNIVSIASSGTPSCVNPQTSSSVVLTVVNPPIAGTSTSTIVCVLSPSFDLFSLLGPTAQTGGTWTPVLASGTGVFDPAVDTAGTYTYTLSGTAPCQSSSATVQVTVNPVPDAGNDGTLNICSNQNPVDLFASLSGTPQSGGTWTPVLASGTGIFNPAVDISGVYTYTVTGIAPCVDDTSSVTVTVTPGPEAGTNNSVTLCVNSPAQDLALLLGPNSQPGGVWSPALASGTGVFDPTVDVAGDYTYTLSGTQPCDNDFAIITVIVNPVPNAGDDSSITLCSNNPAQDLFLLLGSNAQSGGTWSPALASGTGFINPAIDVAGTYTYSVGGGLCATDTAEVIVTLIQAPNSGGIGQTLNTCINETSLDLFTGLDGTQNSTGTWNDDDASGALTGSIFNPSAVAVGTYHFTYTVLGTSPCSNSSSTVTVVVDSLPNAGTFTGVISLCPSVGVLDLTTLLTGQDSGGTWTDGSAQTVTSPITIVSLAAGTYSYTYTVTNLCGTDTETVQFTILPNPLLTTVNVTISPACLGANVVVNLNGMTDGIYTLSYDLAGANTLSGQTTTVTIASGAGNFSIPSASLPNIGTTVITFTNILNTVSNCSNTLTGVAAQIIVRPLADIDSASLTATNVCFGTAVVVDIANAINLPDGVYQFNYSIPGATPTSGVTGNVTVTGGIGQFTIPAAIFTAAGNYTLTIIGIIAATGCTNANENATVSFVINPIPDLNTATLTVQDTCTNYASQATISGTVNMPDGDYIIQYLLSGANSASNTVTVTFTGGIGTFTIPATDLVNNGTTSLTISQIDSVVTTCGVIGNVVMSTDFNVSQLGTPQIIQDGNLFCEDDNPTIENLSGNLVGFPTVIWYNAPTGGTAYSTTDLLVHGTTYYAALTAASGCEGSVRLEVIVDLTVCDDILIPDGYSPNNDGINDTFEIENLATLYPNFKLEIYNRYGNLIYTGNRNVPNWDGTTSVGGLNLGDNLLPTGVYFYILNFNDGVRKAVQGRVYLNR